MTDFIDLGVERRQAVRLLRRLVGALTGERTEDVDVMVRRAREWLIHHDARRAKPENQDD